MRIETTTREIFKFDELSDKAKSKALDYFRNSIMGDSYWQESVFEDCANIFERLGIVSERQESWRNIGNGKSGIRTIKPDISFSGFWSQGDGARFEGTYYFKEDSAKLIREYAPQDETLHNIAEGLAALQLKYGNTLAAILKRNSSNYCHEYSVTVECESENGEVSIEDETELREVMRRLMRWIYSALQSEYEYQTSDECLRETIEANDYEFTAGGVLA